MCLDAENNKIKIAEQNIPCYKFGYLLSGIFQAPIQNFEYKKNKLQILVHINIDINNNRSVYAGYHTFNILTNAKCNCSSTHGIGLFIIPKGTRYIDGNFHGWRNRVSETLIYVGRNNWWNRWRAKIKYGVKFDK